MDQWLLSGTEAAEADGGGGVGHELEHEARHLSPLTVGGGIVVDEGDVVGALQQTVEVVLVDGHLVVDGSQSVSLAYGVGDE